MLVRFSSSLFRGCAAIALAGLILTGGCSDNTSGPTSERWQTEASGTNVSLLGVFGFSRNDIYAVGDQGVILHSDGSGWSAMDSHTDRLLHGIWGFASDNLYAVGDSGLIMHYDGANWDSVRWGGDDLFTIKGIAPDNIYAFGRYGFTLHYNGSSWTQLPPPEGVIRGFYGGWVGPMMSAALGPEERVVIGVGEWGTAGKPGLFEAISDSTWTPSLSDLSQRVLRAVWGRTAADLFVVGNNGYIAHLDSTGWRTMDDGGTTSHLYAIDGAPGGPVIAVGLQGTILRLDGDRWQPTTGVTSEHLYSVWVSPDGSDVIVTGRYGLILHGTFE